MRESLPGSYDAVILAGGNARRMRGRDKPGLAVGGRALVMWVADAVPDAGRIVLVGPARPELARSDPSRQDLPRLINVCEEPPGSGPVPALRAGLAQVRAPWVAVLAADLPFLRAEHLVRLRRQGASGDGAVLVDTDGRAQWLAGVWRTAALSAALATYPGSSLYGLLAPLRPRPLALTAARRPAWYDCDTPTELERARRWADGTSTDNPSGGSETAGER